MPAQVVIDGCTYVEHDLLCAECGASMRLRNSRYGLFYGCTRWPQCDGKHGAHRATGAPLGKPVDKATRAARIRAHDAFDTLWNKAEKKGQYDARSRAYLWMCEALGLPRAEAHIGSFDIATCERLIEAVQARDRSYRDSAFDGPYECPWCSAETVGYQWFLRAHECDGYRLWRRNAFR